MKIDIVHYDIAIQKIIDCKPNTAYSDSNIDSMIESAKLGLNLLEEINNKIFTIKTILDKEELLLVKINDIKFFHNCFMIYADYKVLKFIENYIDTYVKEHEEDTNTYKLRTGSNGYGTAISIDYDSWNY